MVSHLKLVMVRLPKTDRFLTTFFFLNKKHLLLVTKGPPTSDVLRNAFTVTEPVHTLRE